LKADGSMLRAASEQFFSVRFSRLVFDSFSSPGSRSRVENGSSWQRSELVPCSIFYRHSYYSGTRFFVFHLVFLPVAFLLPLGFWSPCRFPVCVPARWPDCIATRRYCFLHQAVVPRLRFSCSSIVVYSLELGLTVQLAQHQASSGLSPC
jgi:hypothetical protein